MGTTTGLGSCSVYYQHLAGCIGESLSTGSGSFGISFHICMFVCESVFVCVCYVGVGLSIFTSFDISRHVLSRKKKKKKTKARRHKEKCDNLFCFFLPVSLPFDHDCNDSQLPSHDSTRPWGAFNYT